MVDAVDRRLDHVALLPLARRGDERSPDDRFDYVHLRVPAVRELVHCQPSGANKPLWGKEGFAARLPVPKSRSVARGVSSPPPGAVAPRAWASCSAHLEWVAGRSRAQGSHMGRQFIT